MTTAKIAAIQMTSINDIEANLKSADELLHQAAIQGATIAVLPEMFPTLAVENGHLIAKEKMGAGPIQDFLAQKAREYNLWIIGGTIPITCDKNDRVYAACLVYNNKGQYVTRYDKIHLFDANLCNGTECYRESAKTVPGHKPVVFDSPLGKIGLAVCYDIRFPELFQILAKQGVDIFVIPAAFVYRTGEAHWEILCRARAIENLAYVVAADQTGTHSATRRSYGHSMIIDPWGNIVAQRAEGPGVVITDIDLEHLHAIRETLPVSKHKRCNITICQD
jgi:predicted amidohydrolase